MIWALVVVGHLLIAAVDGVVGGYFFFFLLVVASFTPVVPVVDVLGVFFLFGGAALVSLLFS